MGFLMPGQHLPETRDLNRRLQQGQADLVYRQPARHYRNKVADHQDLWQYQKAGHRDRDPSCSSNLFQRLIRHTMKPASLWGNQHVIQCAEAIQWQRAYTHHEASPLTKRFYP
jgi:hypothetical protein